ncbi:MAG: electron transport complex subunit RsxE [Planctomycetes bacterium RIFCSPLOWO2_12_FULL_39_13]|nr:MAG: electron transport complex subunit RsxE [Planctomycetes bacterium GWA2_39_15]OHB41431.1 MAG: electron transport complex subunit RsxE [Planctomycetes bacterium GWC2_39_26]OHB99834.1 MAG: electron transport complex subunit RsxE [Planctomycetes bacterium RIFCSPLOWO2_12_FULL_39_13]
MAEQGKLREFTKGIFEYNPMFVLVLGICPSLAVTTSVKNGMAMGGAATFVLICSNFIISIVRSYIPREIRIPCFIVIIAAFVTMVELVMKAYLPEELNASLGIFIPLIVVNCIIMYRAESFAYKNKPLDSVLDGAGLGLGWTLSLCLISGIRELLGAGTIFGLKISESYEPASVMIMAPGAFIVLGLLLGFFNWQKLRKSEKAMKAHIQND